MPCLPPLRRPTSRTQLKRDVQAGSVTTRSRTTGMLAPYPFALRWRPEPTFRSGIFPKEAPFKLPPNGTS